MPAQRRLPASTRHPLHPVRRLWVCACVAVVAVCAAADVWQGPYHQEGHRGHTVEFEGSRYAIRTHDGKNFNKGTWREDGAARMLSTCCQTIRFEHFSDDTLVDGDGVRWTRSAPVWPLHAEPRAPLTIQVRDADTGDPIRDFTFRYWLEAPKGLEFPDWVQPRTVTNETGSTAFDAPLSCELTLVVDALDYLCHGSGRGYHSFAIQATNTVRKVEVRLQRGLTVEGIVLDAETGIPIPGARVAPIMNCHPSTSPNTERETVTDDDGRFTVHAVHAGFGIHVRHERYRTQEQPGSVWVSQGDDGGWANGVESNVWGAVEGNPFLKRTQVRLVKADHLTGTVQTNTGEPLADVTIGHSRPPVRSRSDGGFDFYVEFPEDGSAWTLPFTKPGFLPRDIQIRGTTNHLDVVMTPQYHISGRVLAPDGCPVPAFTLAVGDEDYSYRSSKTLNVTNAEGRFSVEVNGPLTNIVSALAPGYAATHARVELRRDMPSVEIVLTPGLDVSGNLAAPEAALTNLVVSLKAHPILDPWRTLIPEQRPANSPYFREPGADTARRLSDRETRPDTDGAYRFAGVAPGAYTLSIAGDGIVPVQRVVRIAEARQRLPELTITPIGFGAVAGQIFEPYSSMRDPGNPQPWPFADGCIIPSLPGGGDKHIIPSIPGMRKYCMFFKADGQGRYCVSNVPAGRVRVHVEYPVTFDIIESMTATGIVHAGQPAVIDVEWEQEPDPRDAEEDETGIARFQMTVGDGSASDFAKGAALDLDEKPGAKIPFWTLETFVRVDRYPAVFGKAPDRVPMSLTNTLFAVEELPSGRWYLRLAESLRHDDWFVTTCWESEASYITVDDAEADFDVALPPHSAHGTVGDPEGPSHLRDAIHFLDASDGTLRRSVGLGSNGRFFARFLPAGRYHVLARNPASGWGMLRDVRVEGAVDVGNIALQPGVKLIARLAIGERLNGEEPNLSIQARDIVSGITLHADPDSPEDGGEAVFDHLWPGTWELTLGQGFMEDYRVLDVVTNILGDTTSSPVVVELP